MTDKCAGENCTSIDGFNHSVECLFEHFTAYTGAHRESVDVLGKIKKAYFDGYEAAAPAQPPSQGGEAVEVVASIAVDAEGVVRDFTLEPGLDRHPGGYTVTSLMTVAQHKRIVSKLTDAAEALELLRAENAELVAALERLKIAADNIGGEHVTDWQQLIDAADVAESALAKRRGDK